MKVDSKFDALWKGLESEVPSNLVASHPDVIEATGKINDLSLSLSRSEERQVEIEAELSEIGAEAAQVRVAVALGEGDKAELDRLEKRSTKLRAESERIGAEIVAQRKAVEILKDRRDGARDAVAHVIAQELGMEGGQALERFTEAYSAAMVAFREVVRVHKTMSMNRLTHDRFLYRNEYPGFPELSELQYMKIVRRNFERRG